MSIGHSLTALAVLVSAVAAVRADEKQVQDNARKLVWEFESKLSPLGRAPDQKGNNDRDAKVREFFNGLKDSTLKIEAIGMMDSRYVYAIPKDLTAELLGKLVKDDDLKVRARAAHAIGYNGLGDRYADDILKLVKEEDPAVKKAAIYAMGRAANDRFLPQLKELLAHKDRSVRLDAAFQLSWQSADKVADEFRQLLADKDDYVRATGLRYLARYAGEKPPLSVADLEKYLDDPAQDVRLAAIEGLAHRGQDSVKRLARLLVDPSPNIRRQTLQTLGALKAVAQVDDVVKSLADTDVVVRRYATMAMEFVGESRAEALRPLLKDQDSQVRQHAARILGVFKDKAAADALIERLSDKNDYVRREAVVALTKIGAKEHADAVATCLADADEQVRMFAVRGLGLSGEVRFRQRLEELAAKDPSDSVRGLARSALIDLSGK